MIAEWLRLITLVQLTDSDMEPSPGRLSRRRLLVAITNPPEKVVPRPGPARFAAAKDTP